MKSNLLLGMTEPLLPSCRPGRRLTRRSVPGELCRCHRHQRYESRRKSHAPPRAAAQREILRLQEMNTALEVLLRKREQDKTIIQKRNAGQSQEAGRALPGCLSDTR